MPSRIVAGLCSLPLLGGCSDLAQAEGQGTESTGSTESTESTDDATTGAASTRGVDDTTTSTSGADASGADVSGGGSMSGGQSTGDTTAAVDGTGQGTASAATGDSSSDSGGATCSLLDIEDNDLQGTATALPDLGCDDGGAALAASLEAGDPDWFEFFSPWDCGGPPNPTVVVTIDAPASLCVFVDCLQGGTEVACEAGTAASAPSGDPGCCGNGAVQLDINCNMTSDESIDVWMEIAGDPSECVDYTVGYEVFAIE